MSRALSSDSYQAYLGQPGDDDAFVTPFELDAGERIGAPPPRPRSTMLAAALFILALSAAGWMWLQLPAAWTSRALEELSALVAATREAAPAPAVPGRPPENLPDATAAKQHEATREIQAAPGASAGEAVAEPLGPPAPPSSPAEPGTHADASPAADQSPADEKPQPLPPPVADPSDPYQAKALAAGLHPGLSRALLMRLTGDDYRNAARAVKRALGETPDGESLLYPREPKGNAAQFEVKFVSAAAPGCRRYVVIVSKDRWSTTAPAMETCGAGAEPAPREARRAAAP